VRLEGSARHPFARDDLLALGAALELDGVETTLAHGGPEALRLRLGSQKTSGMCCARR